MKDFVKKHPYLTTFIVLVILATIRYIVMAMLVKKAVAKEVAAATTPTGGSINDTMFYSNDPNANGSTFVDWGTGADTTPQSAIDPNIFGL